VQKDSYERDNEKEKIQDLHSLRGLRHHRYYCVALRAFKPIALIGLKPIFIYLSFYCYFWESRNPEGKIITIYLQRIEIRYYIPVISNGILYLWHFQVEIISSNFLLTIHPSTTHPLLWIEDGWMMSGGWVTSMQRVTNREGKGKLVIIARG